MRNLSRFIPGEEVDNVAQWHFSGVNSAFEVVKPKTTMVKVVPPPELQRQEAYDQGFLEGREQAQLEFQQRIDEYIRDQGNVSALRFAALMATAQGQLDAAAQEMAQGVLELACELSRKVVRHELSINPQGLVCVIREALGVFVEESRTTRIKLNPLDMESFGVSLRDEFKHLPLMLEADPLIERGGCVLESPGRVVDGQLEKRWSRVVGQLGLQIPWELSHAGE